MTFAYVPPPKLDRISGETISAVHDDVIEASLVDYVIENRINSESMLDSIAHLPAPLRTWFITFMVDAEVMNGGFNQLFFNPSGELAADAPAAFERIGVADAGECVHRALELLEMHMPALEKASEDGTAEAFSETYLVQPFSELDQLYGSGEERWRNARLRFIRNELAAIRHP